MVQPSLPTSKAKGNPRARSKATHEQGQRQPTSKVLRAILFETKPNHEPNPKSISSSGSRVSCRASVELRSSFDQLR